MKSLEKFLDNKCIFAISGGADSMCMLDMAIKNVKDKSNIIVIHINHNLRGVESDLDAKFVSEFCKKQGVKCIVESVNVKDYAINNKLSIEEAARNLRYLTFRKYKKIYEADYIFVAHNKNDNIETFIHNLLRGSGILGLSGIKMINGDIVRPLINFSRDEIEEYNKNNNVSFRQDLTNFELDYTRNKIRNILLPYFIKEINSKSIEHIDSAIDLLRKQYELISQLVKKEEKRINIENQVCTIKLDDVDNDYLRSEIIRLALNKFFGLKDISRVNIDDLIKLSHMKKQAKINLSNGWIAKRRFGCIEIKKSEDSINVDLKDAIEEKIIINGYKFSIITDNKISLCYDMLREAKIRVRQNGDYLYTNKRVKLKDFLIKKKINPLLRDELLLVAIGQRIIWIEGLYVDNNFRALNEKGVKIKKHD